MKEFTVKKQEKLKNFTDNTYPQGSFFFNTLLKKKDIRINGVKTDRDVLLRVGDRVTYYTTSAQESKTAFSVIYRDENILVIDKESGVNAEAVFYTLSDAEECYFIHRLDRNTAGLMIFARTKVAEESLLSAFRKREVKKIYHAICVGIFRRNAGMLTAYLQKDPNAALVRASAERGKGEKIVTEYRVMKSEGGLSYVEVVLHTGKTHQIRAHMAYIGHPVLGDGKYGDEEANKRYNLTRQQLIAKQLSFSFPFGDPLFYLNGKIFLSPRNLPSF